MRQRTAGICIRTTDYSETSQVAWFLTRNFGLVRVIAKGSKRPRSASGGALDLLAEGELVFVPSRSGGLGTLTEFTESATHLRLRTDAGRLNAALYTIELVGETIAEDDPHPEVYDLLRGALGRLGDDDASPPAVLAYFQWRLLRHVGLLGALDACVACGGPVLGKAGAKDVYFSSRQGGLLCGGCEAAETVEKTAVGGAALAGLAALAAVEAGRRVKLPDSQARAVNRLLAYHVAHQTGKPLRMARYVGGT